MIPLVTVNVQSHIVTILSDNTEESFDTYDAEDDTSNNRNDGMNNIKEFYLQFSCQPV